MEVKKIEVEPIYTMLLSDEERLLLKTRKIREDMVDEFIKNNNGVPTKTSEMRVINEVLNSIDDQTLGLVDRRFKHEENEQLEDITAIIKEVFTNVDKFKKKADKIDIDDKYIPTDIVVDEDSIEFKELNFEDLE